MRKVPTQRRAKARVEQILDAAESLLVEQGVGHFRMNEIAERAAVPVGSVYQYFSSREDILKGIANRHYENIEREIGNHFSSIGSIAEFVKGVRSILTFCWNYVVNNPSYRELLFGVQTWEVVREIDWQDTLANAKVMSEAFRSMVPYVPEKQLLAFCTIICDSGGSTARLATRFEDLRDDLLEQFILMAESHIFTLLRENAELERRHAARGSTASH